MITTTRACLSHLGKILMELGKYLTDFFVKDKFFDEYFEKKKKIMFSLTYGMFKIFLQKYELIFIKRFLFELSQKG